MGVTAIKHYAFTAYSGMSLNFRGNFVGKSQIQTAQIQGHYDQVTVAVINS